jgi:hypothetical protein
MDLNTYYDDWEKGYIRLALMINRHFDGFVDAYVGPAEISSEVEAEPDLKSAELVAEARELLNTLPVQGYDNRRTEYLKRQLLAIKLICDKLNGNSFSYTEEVTTCFNIKPERVPETVFENALADLDELVPGEGTLLDRLEARKKKLTIPPDKLMAVAEYACKVVRERSARYYNLPEGENLEITLVKNQPWSAYNWYLGNYRSRIEINTDLPVQATYITRLVCHEAYPGHHLEHALKEKNLFREKGYLENSIMLINTPECVISEGIGNTAERIIFDEDELFEWQVNEIFPRCGITGLTAVEEARIARAQSDLNWVRGNVAFMVHEDGINDAEAVDYLKKYSLRNEDEARKALSFIKSPLWRPYIFTYLVGEPLLRQITLGDNRQKVFGKFLSEQIYPDLCLEWAINGVPD